MWGFILHVTHVPHKLLLLLCLAGRPLRCCCIRKGGVPLPPTLQGGATHPIQIKGLSTLQNTLHAREPRGGGWGEGLWGRRGRGRGGSKGGGAHLHW